MAEIFRRNHLGGIVVCGKVGEVLFDITDNKVCTFPKKEICKFASDIAKSFNGNFFSSKDFECQKFFRNSLNASKDSPSGKPAWISAAFSCRKGSRRREFFAYESHIGNGGACISGSI